MEYTIHIEVRDPVADPTTSADDLMDLLEPHAGVVAIGPDGWSATLTLDHHDDLAAIHTGREQTLAYAEKVGLPTSPVVKLEATRSDVLDEELTRPNYPDLVSGPEAAAILGVTRQRVHQLATAHPDFPVPMYKLGVGSLWTRSAIEAFAAGWERKPGRPRSAPSRPAPRVKPPTPPRRRPAPPRRRVIS